MRTRKGAASRKARKRLLRDAKGYHGARGRLYAAAKETLRRAWRYSWAHRRQKKRDFRSLWITRLSAAAHMRGISYSRFVSGLRRAEVALNRKILADLAVSDPAAFDTIVEIAKSQL